MALEVGKAREEETALKAWMLMTEKVTKSVFSVQVVVLGKPVLPWIACLHKSGVVRALCLVSFFIGKRRKKCAIATSECCTQRVALFRCGIFTDDPGAANDVSGVCGSLRQASLSPDKVGSSLCVQEQKTMFKLRLFRCKAKRACP